MNLDENVIKETIKNTEGGTGLSKILEDDLVPLPEQSLGDLQKDIIKKIDEYAKKLHEKIAEKYSSEEMAGWTQKKIDCQIFLDKGIISPALEIEIARRYPSSPVPEAATILAPFVLLKADFFHAATARIAGARGRHSDAISLMQTKEEVINYDWWSEGWN